MKPQSLSEINTENLRKNYKAMKLAAGILSGLFVVMAVTGIYITFTKGFSTISILPLLFLPIFIGNIINLKKIKTELISRGETMS